MKKTIICNIPMKEIVESSVYTSDDNSLSAVSIPVMYPINAVIGNLSKPEDEYRVLVLVKKDKYGHYEKHTNSFKAEFMQAINSNGDNVEFIIIDTDFDQSRAVHEKLMCSIVENIDDEASILADVTYGPKDLPVVIFSALNFAEKHLGCNVENIVYGQASFVDGKVVDTKLQDMSPLYYLSSITQTIKSSDSEKARKMLNSLMSM